MESVRAAVASAHEGNGELAILAGGHSFSGRMTSMPVAAEPIEHVRGLVILSFPLHPPDKPATDRADHLSQVPAPMLFLSGTRDKLAELKLLQPVCKKLGGRATLHLLDTADHGFKVLKRTRNTDEDVFVEIARVIYEWVSKLS